MEAIKARYMSVHSNLTDDKIIWPLETLGESSVKLYYWLKRPKGTQQFAFKYIWAPFIIPRIAFFMCRLFHNAILTDMNIRILLASKCCCYKEGNTKDVDHLLLRSDLAKSIWGHFANIFEVRNLRFFNIKSIFLE